MIGHDLAQNAHETPKQLFEAAEQARKSGDVARASALYSAVLTRVPFHAKAKKALIKIGRQQSGTRTLTQSAVNEAVALLQSGQFSQAAEKCRALILIAPKEALLHNLLGMCLAHLGEADAAQASYQKAVDLKPDYAEALGNLGTSFVVRGEAASAMPYLERALARKPDFAEAYQSMGTAHLHNGDGVKALAAFDSALRFQPGYFNAEMGKCRALEEMGDAAQAVEFLEPLLRKYPDTQEVVDHLARCYTDLWRFDDAISLLEHHQPNSPDPAQNHYHLAVLLGNMGRRDDSLTHYRTALKLNRHFFQAYRSMGEQITYATGDPQIDTMRTLLQENPDDNNAVIHLNFALAKALEDIGDDAHAFAHLDKANKARRAQLSYSTAAQRDEFARIKSAFAPQFYSAYKNTESSLNKPIFIVGMNRSGTSMVEQMLASHSQIDGGGELTHFQNYTHNYLGGQVGDERKWIVETGDDYCQKLRLAGLNAPRVTDKMPMNFRHIGLIKTVFPDAKIVHMTRDPRDSCLSNYKQYFDTGGNQYVYDLRELGAFYVMYRDLMDHWHAQFPGEIHDCSYESLVGDPETQSRQLLDYCELEWEDAVLTFHTSKRAVRTASVSQVRNEIYTTSVQSWRRYETQLAPLINVISAAGRLPD